MSYRKSQHSLLVKPRAGRVNWAYPLSQNLRLWWLMSEVSGKVIDQASGRYHGTVGTVSSSPTWSRGKWGPCLSCASASSQYLQVETFLKLNGAAKATISVWFNTGTSHQAYLFGAPFSAAANGFDVYCWSDGTVGTDIKTSATTLFKSFAVAYNDSRWHHLAATYDGATLSLYFDGLLRSSGAITGTIATSASIGLYLGRGAAGQFFNGRLDNAQVWLGRALLATEIRTLWQAPFAGLVSPRRRVHSTVSVAGPPADQTGGTYIPTYRRRRR